MANFFNRIFGKNENNNLPMVIQTTDKPKQFGFTSPFGQIGDGNLSLPYINSNYKFGNGYVPFGADNLYPNLLRQLYHTSPLHASIMNYINNATVGGGFEILNGNESAQGKIKQYKFENSIQIKKFVKNITTDALMFGVINFIIENDNNGIAKTIKRIPMDELRWDDKENKFHYSKDFSRTTTAQSIYDKYQVGQPNHRGILTFRFDTGDEIYPLPTYATAANWIFLDGESSYLHKANILNSIFPSMVFKFPKKPASDEEANFYRNLIDGAKGAGNAGKAIAFFENGADLLPTIDTIDTSNNDKLFLQTDERTDSKIAQAWNIDPLLLGIRVSGKLGSGTDIQIAYTIFEKNTIMPLRSEIEDVVNVVMDLFQVQGNFKFKNYQIIDTQIKEQQIIK